MRRMLLAILALAACAAKAADTNELERLRTEYIAARTAYMAARKAAGLTNAAPRVSASSTRTVFTKSQARFFKNRRICVSRDTTTIPGSVITTWHRNGKLDTIGLAVVTNALQNIVGAEQSNPLQILAERYRVAASDATRRLAEVTEDYMSASNRAARAEARHAAIVAWAEEQRDKAILSTTKAVWQSIIDRLEENQ